MSTNLLLSFTIPTFNRANYLNDLLSQLIPQCDELNEAKLKLIKIIISDNASTDNTQEIIKKWQRPYLKNIRNSKNIGGDPNFIECVKKSQGQYIWICGDDELLCPNAIEKVLSIIQTESPALIIASDKAYNPRLQTNSLFANYQEFLSHFSNIDPYYPLSHTLISTNIFKRNIYNESIATMRLPTNYAHMYAIMPSLSHNGKIYAFKEPIIETRAIKTPFAVHPKFLLLKQAQYLVFVGKTFHNKKIIRYAYYFFIHRFVKRTCYLLWLHLIRTPAKKMMTVLSRQKQLT